MVLSNRKSCNGVKGVHSVSGREASPGTETRVRQGNLDRNQATASESESKPKGNRRYGNNENCSRIGTWNVRTLYQAGKLQNVLKEMKRLKCNILGICETRWTGAGCIREGDYTITYSGGDEHRNGVAIITDESKTNCIQGSWQISDRVMMMKLKGLHFNINVIQVYAPTAQSEDEEIERFYDDLDNARRQCKSQEVVIVRET